MSDIVRQATVVVIGAGQAGLSAAYHLQRRGFASALDEPNAARSYVVFDAAPGAGGAWRDRWESLRMETVNGIFDLPGYPQPPIDPQEPSRDAVPRYFDGFERAHNFAIVRPVRVLSVERENTDPDGWLDVETMSTEGGPHDGSGGVTLAGTHSATTETWRTRAVINATGTWTNPTLPVYPGADSFIGRQLHTSDYVHADEFAGQRVAIVGGGISAVQQLEEISRATTTFWYTRREPYFLDHEFTSETGAQTVGKVIADVEAGRPTGSVVSYTGLAWTPYAVAAKERGALERRPMFSRIEPLGVREADGSFTPLDVILWATGFKPALAHLDPLHLRNDLGGITLRGTQVEADPRVHLIGFGPSQSTVGANRAGRAAVATITKTLEGAPVR
jgi:cation diffusion facilitator CzcD-associated flavoprotein CzcO